MWDVPEQFLDLHEPPLHELELSSAGRRTLHPSPHLIWHQPLCLLGQSWARMALASLIVLSKANLSFFVGRHCVVSDFKIKIQRERAMGILKDVDPHMLEMWQVSVIDESQCAVTWLTPAPNRSKLISKLTISIFLTTSNTRVFKALNVNALEL